MSSGERRVLIVGPSLRYLGGQAVQAARLVEGLRKLDGLHVEYLVVDPVLPAPFDALQRVKLVRTVVTSAAYFVSLLRKVPSAHTIHVFSASYWSLLLAPTPAMLIGRLFGYTTRQEQRRDLLVLITPHLIDEGQLPSETVRR